MNASTENPAVIAAQEAQDKVNACLDSKKSFRLEAGAGAGKTYSLVAALKRLVLEKGAQLMQAGQKIACITFTENGRKEIAQDIEDHPAIFVSTIHAFSWAFLSQFQKGLRNILESDEARREKIDLGGGIGPKPIEYNRGYFTVDESRVTLAHDDIPLFMAKLLSYEKFRRLLVQQFPIIFIDEYQDTDRDFMAAITEHFFKAVDGPLVGLFGDHWQTIYRSEYELADYPVQEIAKGSNFRSVPNIITVLNKLRPELPQAFSNPTALGEARFFHTNSFKGLRTNEPHSKQDLAPELARSLRETLVSSLEKEGWDLSTTKILLLTHNALAEQRYPSIEKIFKGRSEFFAKKEDPVIEFLLDTVEPMCTAYAQSSYGQMFKLFGSRPAIRAHRDKISWRKDMDDLQRLRREGTIGEVLEHLKKTNRPQLPNRVLRREEELNEAKNDPTVEPSNSLERHKALRAVAYSEIPELLKFVDGQTSFATQHSVKGAEFENVLVVLGGGWNHYNWPKLFELLETKAIDRSNSKGFYRARNLFYVALSRPKVRLAVLATQSMSVTAMKTATKLFGSENIFDIADRLECGL